LEPRWNRTWFDDLGSWSAAVQRTLHKSFNLSADLVQQLRSTLKDCWTRYTGNAPFTRDRQVPGEFDPCGPAVDESVELIKE
jgi:hypothetical protein